MTPKPTDVLSYAYLWSHEADSGREEGLKDRPVVVVLSVTQRGGVTEVVVVPVTTRQPKEGNSIELPIQVKRHLGLDDRRSWIVTDEVNRFNWPGPDLRPIQRGSDPSPYFGKIPEKLLESIRALMADSIKRKRLKDVRRTD